MTFKNLKLKLPDGSIQEVKYPEEWTEEQIKESVFKHMPQYLDKSKSSPQPKEDAMQSPEEQTGLSGVIGDVGRGVGNAVKGGINFAREFPKKLEKSGKYIEENPGKSILHNAGQVAAETGDIGKSFINAPYNLNQYLARKHLLPQVLGKLGKLIPHLPEDTGVENALGLKGDKTKGDDLFRSIPNIAAVGAGVTSLAKGVKNLVSAPSKERLFQRALEEKIDKAAKEKGLASGELDQLKDSLQLEYSKMHPGSIGELSPVGQEVAINQKTRQLEANPKKNEVPEGELPEVPEAPDTKGQQEEHQKAIDETKEAAEKGLDILDNPKIKAGGKIKTAIENLHSKASGLYKSARKYYVDKKISADNSAEIKAATDELEALKASDELAPGYGSGTPEEKALQANIDALKGEKVNASDIFDLQRTLEKMAENTRDRQYAAGKGTTDLERKRLGQIADNLDAHADKLAKRLEAVGGKDVQKIITEANKGWRTYKQLIKENPVGKAALKGNVPNETLIKLAEQHSANDFLKGLVDSDPELRKQLLAAYSGEKNVNRLLNPSTVIKKYIESLPQVEEYLNAYKNALSDYKANEKSGAKVKKAHDELVASMKQVAEAKSLQQQIKFHEEAIPKIEAKMAKFDSKSSEHAKLEKQLSDHKKHLSDKNHLLKKYGKYALGALGVNELSRRLGF